MPITLLVVDDSNFFQKRISQILKPVTDIKIIGFASNGREAIEKCQSLKPDVITMDYEMPVMDGLTALRNIMQSNPTPVLMFSSLSYDGARVTLDALDAGAVDFLPKNFEDLQRGGQKITNLLTDKIRNVAKQYNRSAVGASSVAAPVAAPESKPIVKPSSTTPIKPVPQRPVVQKTPPQAPVATAPATKKPSQPSGSVPQDTRLGKIDVVLIGTSTGGPVALQKVMTALPANFPKPIILIQHMPASFTGAFAERLDKMCQVEVRLAQDGDIIKPGTAYLAPGGQQLILEKNKIRIFEGDDRVSYRPSVDITFASAAKYFPAKALGIVLTGMGSDGCEGARLMHQSGCPIWAQDQKTSVIYGMPMAIAKANLAKAILPLQSVAPSLLKELR